MLKNNSIVSIDEFGENIYIVETREMLSLERIKDLPEVRLFIQTTIERNQSVEFKEQNDNVWILKFNHTRNPNFAAYAYDCEDIGGIGC